MKCPIDCVPLAQAALGGLPVHVCPTCAGVWVGAGTLRRAGQEAATHALRSARTRRKAPGTAMQTAATPARTLGCPACAKPLRAHEVEGVEIDVCPACHGLWLDHGEFDRVVQWHQARAGTDTVRPAGQPSRGKAVGEGLLDAASWEAGELAVRGVGAGARLVARSVVDTAHTGLNLVTGDAETIVQLTAGTARTLAGAAGAIGEFVGHVVEATPEVLGGLLEGL